MQGCQAGGNINGIMTLQSCTVRNCHVSANAQNGISVGSNGLVVSDTFGQCDVFKGVRSKGDSVVLEMDKYNAGPDAPSQGSYDITLFKGKLVSFK